MTSTEMLPQSSVHHQNNPYQYPQTQGGGYQQLNNQNPNPYQQENEQMYRDSPPPPPHLQQQQQNHNGYNTHHQNNKNIQNYDNSNYNQQHHQQNGYYNPPSHHNQGQQQYNNNNQKSSVSAMGMMNNNCYDNPPNQISYGGVGGLDLNPCEDPGDFTAQLNQALRFNQSLQEQLNNPESFNINPSMNQFSTAAFSFNGGGNQQQQQQQYQSNNQAQSNNEYNYQQNQQTVPSYPNQKQYDNQHQRNGYNYPQNQHYNQSLHPPQSNAGNFQNNNAQNQNNQQINTPPVDDAQTQLRLQQQAQENKQIEITLIVEQLGTNEKFQFCYSQYSCDLDMLIDEICFTKGIERTEEMRLVLMPDFIVLDMDCIEDGDTIVLKNVQQVQSLEAIGEMQMMQLHQQSEQAVQFIRPRGRRPYVRRAPHLAPLGPHPDSQMQSIIQHQSLDSNQNSVGDGSIISGGQIGETYMQGGKLRRRGKRGRPPKNGYTDDSQPKNKQLLDKYLLTTTAKKGFKAIIPFTDRNNRMSTSTAFCCSLAGQSARKKSTNCPFKVTYTKNFQDQYYRMEDNFQSQHNHGLPIEDYLLNDNSNGGEVVEHVFKEQEQIIEKLMQRGKKAEKNAEEFSQHSSTSSESSSQGSNHSRNSRDSRDGGGSKRKNKEKKKNKKKKKKSEKKEKMQINFESIRSQVSQNSQSSQEVLIFDEL
eukprot:403356570